MLTLSYQVCKLYDYHHLQPPVLHNQEVKPLIACYSYVTAFNTLAK